MKSLKAENIKYRQIAIAGTFDQLHLGHHQFILRAFEIGDRVVIGLTSDNYVKNKFGKASRHLGGGLPRFGEAGRQARSARHDSCDPPAGEAGVEEFVKRKEELEVFLKREKLLERVRIVQIDDIYGPAVEKNDIEALLVTRETAKGARLVNLKRKELGMKPLKIIRINYEKSSDNKKISSTRIRQGEIDREGCSYVIATPIKSGVQSRGNKDQKISEEIRNQLKKPQGILLKGHSDDLNLVVPQLKNKLKEINPSLIVTVGDEVTKLANEIGLKIDLAIFDYRVNREKKYKQLSDLGFSLKGLTLEAVRNPSGHISATLVEAVRKNYRGLLADGKQRLIRVIGEDDLAGVPAILLAPLGTIVIYGQPGLGIVVVEVTQEKKEEMKKILYS